MGLTVRLLDPGDREALERYLRQQPAATIFYRPEWYDVLRETYGHRCDYWIALDEQGEVGVFPIVEMGFPVLGRKFVASPYQMHGGMPIAADAAVERKLVHAAVSRARERGARYVEIRHSTSAPWLGALGFREVRSGIHTTEIDLARCTFESIRRNHRRSVRAAAVEGVQVEPGTSLTDLRTFWDLYVRERRHIGAPLAGWTFFERLFHRVPGAYEVLLARHGGRAVGGLLVVRDGRTAFARDAAYSTPAALALHVGAALYWKAIQDAVSAGCESFSCGISWEGDSGLIHWKEGWGGTTRPVRLSAVAFRGDVPEPGGYFEGYRLAKAAWRLLPLRAVDVAGRWITRWVG